ncbi:IS110 family transposase [Pseudaminobacter arsenicus]|uniref:IS110 family transposase n=1 Tax=Borborobacter arsenicus TaxID=1851146 RepID=A0A432V008_9HYPH|nr:IS110 family transposase [Pseudaminobacter arsenicus]RUM95438.1 IS110 family transposase [Pseudaminobacter arsenicus]
MKYFAGLDVSLNETAICVVDEEGIILKEGSVPSEPDAIMTWIRRLDVVISRAGLEIGGLSRWLYGELRAAGLHAFCIDPRKLRGITKTMPVKSDRNDARAIAQVMRVGWYSIVHVKSHRSQEMRMLLTNRRTLLTKQIDIENEIRGTLRVFGVKLSGRITQANFERLALELVEPHPTLAAMIRPMLIARAALRDQYAVLHKMLLRMVRDDEACRRLMTIPGVGALTAVMLTTTIDDPDRFQRSRDVGAHLGMTPRKYASGEIDRNGGISKCGDASIRATLYQASLALLCRSQRWSKLRTWGMAAVKRRGVRRAIVAVGRKMAVLMHWVWADGTSFRWGNEVTA